MEKICWQITVAAFMQPLQYDLRSPAAKDNSITHAAVARSNLDAAITMRSAKTELPNTIELRATGSEIAGPKPDSRRQSEKKMILKHFLKGFLEGKSLAPKWRKSAHKSLSQPSCSHSNTIYEVQLQKTIVLRMQPKEEATLAIPLTLRERSYSCKAQWKSIGNSSTSNTCNPIYIAGRILQLQITMEFCRPHMHEKHLTPHLQCGTDPNMIRTYPTTHETVSQPSHRRGRSSRFGDGLCMEKHRVSCICYISQKRISCETSSKTLSATPPPAPLAMLFTLREASYSCKSQWNSIDNSSGSTTCNPIYIAGTILQLRFTMEFCRPHMHEKHLTPHLQCGTDPNMIRTYPTTHETVSQPSHRRGRSSRFGDGLCMEKHRVSCICYLSKTHFVRDFLQNSIGNSSTSTTCNAIYSEGTILQLQITMPWLTLSLTNSFFD